MTVISSDQIRRALARTTIASAACAFMIAGGGAAFATPQPASSAAPAPPASQNAASQGYIIHPHDVLDVQVFNDPSLTQNVTVLPTGDISYPLVGKIHVGGLTPEQAAKVIAKALTAYVRHPFVNVIVAQQGPLEVLVLGNVKTPGKYSVAPMAKVTDAIAAAGGMGVTNGPLPDARIVFPDQTTKTTSLEKLLRNGDTSQDVPLTDQAVVYVPGPTTIDIEVTGAVDHPGEIELYSGDRLSMAIAKAGNSGSADSDLNNIHITRVGPDGKPQDLNVNLYQTLQQGDISKDVLMQKGDVVFVPRAKHGLNGTGSGASGNPAYLLLLTLKLLFPHI